MSRLAKTPVTFGKDVTVNYKDKALTIKGKIGEVSFNVPEIVDLEIDKESIQIKADLESKEGRTMAGTVGSIVRSMVHGVSSGFTTVLELVGVGYRAQVQGQKLTMALGFSHPIEYQLPKIVKGEVENNTKLTLTSCDKQVLGQVAAEIRKYRPPEPYKGKGILFAGEQIRRKAGKAAKAAV